MNFDLTEVQRDIQKLCREFAARHALGCPRLHVATTTLALALHQPLAPGALARRGPQLHHILVVTLGVRLMSTMLAHAPWYAERPRRIPPIRRDDMSFGPSVLG